jgi:hypothetical protein
VYSHGIGVRREFRGKTGPSRRGKVHSALYPYPPDAVAFFDLSRRALPMTGLGR